MSTTLMGYSMTQSDDQIVLEERFRVDVASGSAAQMASRAFATLGAAYAVGATRYGSTVKVYQRTVDFVEGVHLDVNITSRTEQFDDLIQNSASGTQIDKGLVVDSEIQLRDRSPTGALFSLGNWRYERYNTEPRLGVWFDRIHDSPPYTLSRSIVGRVNSATFLSVTSPLVWLCQSVDTNTVRTDSGDRYLSRYSFAYKAETWNILTARYLWNSRTIASITAATTATGNLTVFAEYNFATLGFTM